MVQFVATLTDNFEDNSVLDGNVRLVISDSVKLALLKDGFLNVLDAHWTKATVFGGTYRDRVNESGGVVKLQILPGDGSSRECNILYPYSFNLATAEVDVTNYTLAGPGGVGRARQVGLMFQVDSTHWVFIRMLEANGVQEIHFRKRTGGSVTSVASFTTAVTSFDFKMERRAANVFEVWYDLKLGGGFISMGTTTAAIGTPATIALFCARTNNNDGMSADFNDLIITGSDVYRDDSPEYFIVKSVIAGNEFCLDAGSGKTLDVISITFNIVEPANTSAKFQWATEAVEGVDDRGAASFNGSWLTAAQLNTAVSAATLKQFLYIKGQANSDSSDTIDMQDMTFNYDVVGGVAVYDHHYRQMRA